MLPGREKREARRESHDAGAFILPSLSRDRRIGVSVEQCESYRPHPGTHHQFLSHWCFWCFCSFIIRPTLVPSAANHILSRHTRSQWGHSARLLGRCWRNSSKHGTFLVTIQTYNDTGTGTGRVGNQQTNPVSSSNNHPTSSTK